MVDYNRKLLSARKFITGYESKVFVKLFTLLNKSNGSNIVLGEYKLKFAYCEVKIPDKPELEVVEDIPESLEGLYSMSFDLFHADAQKASEVIFYKDSVNFDRVNSIFTDHRKVENLMISVLKAPS